MPPEAIDSPLLDHFYPHDVARRNAGIHVLIFPPRSHDLRPMVTMGKNIRGSFSGWYETCQED